LKVQKFMHNIQFIAKHTRLCDNSARDRM